MDIEKANESINVPFNSHEEYFTRSVCISLLNIIVLDLESCFLLKHCTLLSSVFLTINCMPIKVFLPWEDLRFFRLTAVLSFLYFFATSSFGLFRLNLCSQTLTKNKIKVIIKTPNYIEQNEIDWFIVE